jgi:hypothetical protein
MPKSRRYGRARKQSSAAKILQKNQQHRRQARKRAAMILQDGRCRENKMHVKCSKRQNYTTTTVLCQVLGCVVAFGLWEEAAGVLA